MHKRKHQVRGQESEVEDFDTYNKKELEAKSVARPKTKDVFFKTFFLDHVQAALKVD